jgi:acetyl esterase/lipase
MSNIMVDKAGDIAAFDGPGCTYDADVGTCTDIEGGYAYHSCTVPLKITGTIPRSDYVCPGQPDDWLTEWTSPDEGNPPVGGGTVCAPDNCEPLVPGLYRRESSFWTNSENAAGEYTGIGDNFPLGGRGWDSRLFVPEKYRTWAPESVRLQDEGQCAFIPGLRGSSWLEAAVWEASQIEVTSDIQYGTASLYSQVPDVSIEEEVPLFLDLYLPPDATADFNCVQEPCERPMHPAAVLVHGGGYSEGLYKDDDGYPELATLLAMRGFVVVSIDYRLMRADRFENQYDYMSEIPQLSASEDARAAVRYVNSKANDWGVDTSKIMIGGGSVGAGTSNYLSYVEVAEDEGSSGNPDFAPSQVALCLSISSGFPYGVDDRLNDIGAEGKDHPALLMIHNEGDIQAPFANALDMRARARETGIPALLVTLPGNEHVDWDTIFSDERVLQESWEFIVATLKLDEAPLVSSSDDSDNDQSAMYIVVGSLSGVGVLIVGLAYAKNQQIKGGSSNLGHLLDDSFETNEGRSVQSFEIGDGESEPQTKKTQHKSNTGAYSEIASV